MVSINHIDSDVDMLYRKIIIVKKSGWVHLKYPPSLYNIFSLILWTEVFLERHILCQKIYALIEPITHFNGAELVRVRLMGHAHRPTLQIMAERPDCTMDLTLCETLSREYSLLLDVNDIVPSEYVLEVSSPGIDRPLTRFKDFKNWSGFEAIIELNEKNDGRRRFKGILGEPVILNEEQNLFSVTIAEADKIYDIMFDNIKEAKLTLSDALLMATKNGTALHGFPCDEEDVDIQASKTKKLKKIEDIEETVEATIVGEK